VKDWTPAAASLTCCSNDGRPSAWLFRCPALVWAANNYWELRGGKCVKYDDDRDDAYHFQLGLI